MKNNGKQKTLFKSGRRRYAGKINTTNGTGKLDDNMLIRLAEADRIQAKHLNDDLGEVLLGISEEASREVREGKIQESKYESTRLNAVRRMQGTSSLESRIAKKLVELKEKRRKKK